MAKNKNIVMLAKHALNYLLESSSSSSEEEENFVLLTNTYSEYPTHARSFVTDVVSFYSDSEFKKHFRMERETANYLIGRYSTSSSYIKRTFKGGRAQHTPETQMLMFLWFCSNKTTLREISKLFHMSISTAHVVFNKVLNFMVNKIALEEIQFPQDDAAKKEISNTFKSICGFPDVLGCIGSSYIAVRTPKGNVRSTYINRHNSISLTMQGICDANLKFLKVFTGVPNMMRDSHVLNISFIGKQLPKICSPGYHILGDSGYPHQSYLLTPYRDHGQLTEAEKAYNDKFSKTYVKIENTLAMLKCRFRQLTMRLDFHDAKTMGNFIVACCALHNICINRNDFLETEDNIEPESVPPKRLTDNGNK